MTDTLPATLIPDQTLAFLREGYTFISRRCERLRTDAFRTRLLMRPVICMRGTDAVELFYQPDAFARADALPPQTLRLLQGAGTVLTLDGASHQLRRRLFLDLLDREGSRRLVEEFERVWRRRSERWRTGSRIDLDRALPRMLAEAAMRWLGLNPEREGLAARTAEAEAMVRHAAVPGPGQARALWLRRRAEHWAERLVRDLRRQPRSDTPASRVARGVGDDGKLLPARLAGRELLNLLRPVVAVWVFGVFIALSLHRFPRYRDWLAEWDDPARVRAFVQEVRRYWPFFPAVAGVARRDLVWREHVLPRGSRVLLDLYGTNHHPGLWHDPHRFRPERFLARTPGAVPVVAQGGGDMRRGHRCPGEDVTVLLMESLARRLAALRWHAPQRNLSLDLSRIPALPPDGMVLQLDAAPVRISPPPARRVQGVRSASARPRH